MENYETIVKKVLNQIIEINNSLNIEFSNTISFCRTFSNKVINIKDYPILQLSEIINKCINDIKELEDGG